jgi:hypothetical protein
MTLGGQSLPGRHGTGSVIPRRALGTSDAEMACALRHRVSGVSAARISTHATVDIFAPHSVVWSYEGSPQQLRALLELVHPMHPAAPTSEYPAPASLHVPRAQQRPMTIQPLCPSRAPTRAQRLAAGGQRAAPGRWAPATSQPPKMRHTMTAKCSRPGQHRCCDVDGTPLSLSAAYTTPHTAPPSWLYQRGEVVGQY